MSVGDLGRPICAAEHVPWRTRVCRLRLQIARQPSIKQPQCLLKCDEKSSFYWEFGEGVVRKATHRCEKNRVKPPTREARRRLRTTIQLQQPQP